MNQFSTSFFLASARVPDMLRVRFNLGKLAYNYFFEALISQKCEIRCSHWSNVRVVPVRERGL